jgi:adenylate cyclase
MPPAPSPPPIASGEKFVAASIPFIGDRTRNTLASDYAPVGDFKAFSLNTGGFNGFVTGQSSEEAAKIGAVEQCQKRADAAGSPRKCELYAVGNIVVYAHGKPPVPPLPWIKRDEATERPFAAKDVPLTRDLGKSRLEKAYVPGRKSKALALGPDGGQYFMISGMETIEEAARRSLESCGAIAGVPCMIVALDDAFVVPIPTTLKATGFFRIADSPLIAPDARGEAARKFAEAPSGWNAVAVGTARRPGLAVKQASEQAAVNQALSECVKRDSDCHIVAIGPFAVGPT